MKTFILTLAFIILASGAMAQALDLNKENTNFATCTPTRFTAPHPQLPGQVVTLQIHGMVNGKCKYTQTIPQTGVVTCMFSDEQRREIGVKGLAAAGAIMQDPNTCSIVSQ